DLESIAPFTSFDRVERYGEMATRIERENVDRRARRRDGVQDRLILDAKARRERDASRHGARNKAYARFEIGLRCQFFRKEIGRSRQLGENGRHGKTFQSRVRRRKHIRNTCSAWA